MTEEAFELSEERAAELARSVPACRRVEKVLALPPDRNWDEMSWGEVASLFDERDFTIPLSPTEWEAISSAGTTPERRRSAPWGVERDAAASESSPSGRRRSNSLTSLSSVGSTQSLSHYGAWRCDSPSHSAPLLRRSARRSLPPEPGSNSSVEAVPPTAAALADLTLSPPSVRFGQHRPSDASQADLSFSPPSVRVGQRRPSDASQADLSFSPPKMRVGQRRPSDASQADLSFSPPSMRVGQRRQSDASHVSSSTASSARSAPLLRAPLQTSNVWTYVPRFARFTQQELSRRVATVANMEERFAGINNELVFRSFYKREASAASAEARHLRHAQQFKLERERAEAAFRAQEMARLSEYDQQFVSPTSPFTHRGGAARDDDQHGASVVQLL